MSDPNIEAIYRLSPLQQGILYHSLESGGGSIYFEQYSCDYSGPLDPVRMQSAWATVIQRHAVLRTLFTWERHDQPLQIVRETVSLPWSRRDWQEYTDGEQATAWELLLQQDRQLGFDLGQAPNIRLTLIWLGVDRWRLLWSFHHILLDGWSMRMILAEVVDAHDAAIRGEAVRLDPSPPYASFIAWLERQDRTSSENFWRNYLTGFQEPNNIALPRPAKIDTELSEKARQTVERQLSAATMPRLRAFAQSQRITLNTLLVGAWALVVGRHSQSNDIVFGATVAGRAIELQGVEKMAGLLINTLPVRTILSPNREIGDWLREIQSLQSQTLGFEQTSLVDIQRWSELPRGTSLFDSILVFENFGADSASRAESALIVDNEQYIEYSNYPLAILVVPEDELELIVVYDPARYDHDAVIHLLDHLQDTLLRLTEADAGAALSALMLGPQAERLRVLDEWNRTEAAYPSESCIHELIDEAAARDPNAQAVVYEGRSISYRELGDKANQLANYLIGQGLRHGERVPVFFERTIAAIVAIVGVLKAGGAYVPLDPELPQARIRQVLDDLTAASAAENCNVEDLLVLSQTSLLDRIPLDGLRCLCIDGNWGQIAQAKNSIPDVQADPDGLAYVIYTSGSTGQPKGVLVSHRNLVNSTHARHTCYREPLTAFLLMSSLATDSSVAGLFWALTSGAKLVLPRSRQEQDIDGLLSLVQDQQVSHLLCLPSLYATFLEFGRVETLASLKVVILAGEACSAQLVEQHVALLPNTSLYNEYGPTEGTVWATVARLDQSHSAGTPGIGRPVNNVSVYILDPDLQPVPIGVPGELCIGGLGVARGYLNRPQQSAEKFVANPFRDSPDPVLYRTGDLARYRADGNIDFLGRLDKQIKVRGYRVELEEIEQQLLMHPDVDEIAVMLEADVEALRDALLGLGEEKAERLLAEIEAGRT